MGANFFFYSIYDTEKSGLWSNRRQTAGKGEQWIRPELPFSTMFSEACLLRVFEI